MANEEYVRYFKEFRHYKPHQWRHRLAVEPEVAHVCNWESLRSSDIATILRRNTELHTHVNLHDLDRDDLFSLLAARPELLRHCDNEQIVDDPHKLIELLTKKPRLAAEIDFKNFLHIFTFELLMSQPRIVDYAVNFSVLPLGGEQWVQLLIAHPQLSKHCHWENLYGRDWVQLLLVQPRFAVHCDFALLDGHDWAQLLRHQPQFAEHCDWEEFSGDDCVNLIKHIPQFARYFDLDSLLCDSQWVELRKHQPQLRKGKPYAYARVRRKEVVRT